MGSGALDRIVNLSHQEYRESTDGIFMTKKLFRERRSLNSNRAPSIRGGPNGTGWMEIDEIVPSDPGRGDHRGARHEMDGGVRLAGGTTEEVATPGDFGRHSMSESDGSTLPPPYSSHFRES